MEGGGEAGGELHERSLPHSGGGGVLHVDVHVLPGSPVKGRLVSLMQPTSLSPRPNPTWQPSTTSLQTSEKAATPTAFA